MAEPVIRIEHVSRTYHVGDIDVFALRDVSLTVEHGEFIAIMGASGSGKSTLMSVLGCLDRPTSGRYWFDGIEVAQLAEPDLAGLRSERLGFVFQSFNLLPRTSAIDNVALPLLYAMSGQGHARVRFDRARTVLDKLGLRDRERNTPGQLSGGQQQRVAIARALINQPSLLLADEPTGNLDTRNSNEIMQTLSSLNRQQGVTIIVVTHEPDIAAFADRVLTMRDGQIISDVKNTARDRAPRTAIPDTPDNERRGLTFHTRNASALCRTVGRLMAICLDGDDSGGRGNLAQQDALGPDDARRLHRRRRLDRHGVRRPGGQRGGPQGDRKAGNQPRCHTARGGHQRGRPRWVRKRLNADGRRCPCDPTRGACRW